MPHIKGIRDYMYYNDEDIDHDLSFERVQALRLSRVPAYNPASTLAPIVEALRNLSKNAVRDDDVRESGEEPQQFVAEGDLQLSDLSVTVEGVGVLQVPLEEDTISKLIGVSENIRDNSSPEERIVSNAWVSNMISVTEIRVEIKDEAVNRIVNIISDSLNIDEKCSLKPSFRCMSIYGPGQLCGSFKGSAKEDDNAVRLEIVLPSHFEGGDLHIKHGTQTHKCCVCGDAGSARWTAFYSDCARRMFAVEEGHRVVLVYDVELEYSSEPEPTRVEVDASLNNAVAQHFTGEDRLVVLLLHTYSEHTLHWHMIKGRDSMYARALLAVAENQGLRAYLALVRCLETWETSGYHGPVRNGGSVELHHWVDEGGHAVEKDRVSIDYEGMAREVCTFRDELWTLGEPDEEVKLGWYGEGPAIREQWYHRACVVLLKE